MLWPSLICSCRPSLAVVGAKAVWHVTDGIRDRQNMLKAALDARVGRGGGHPGVLLQPRVPRGAALAPSRKARGCLNEPWPCLLTNHPSFHRVGLSCFSLLQVPPALSPLHRPISAPWLWLPATEHTSGLRHSHPSQGAEAARCLSSLAIRQSQWTSPYGS